MRIATWNINSVRSRLDRVLGLLDRHQIDVLALQETKVADPRFPADAFREAGYQVAHVGHNQWNGVAIASRVGLDDVTPQLPNQPGYDNDATAPQPVEARALGAVCGGVRVWSLYVPNGRQIGARHYNYKLHFLDSLRAYVGDTVAADPGAAMVLLGDFNVAPRDEDVWDRSFFTGLTHVTEAERAYLQAVEEAGVKEVSRHFTTDQRFTYWDYKEQRFSHNEGMRIDFHYATPTLAATATSGFVDTQERAQKGTSDHAPVIVDYAFTTDAPAEKQ